MSVAEPTSKGWNMVTLMGLSLLEPGVRGQSLLDPWAMYQGNIEHRQKEWRKLMLHGYPVTENTGAIFIRHKVETMN